MNGLPLCFCGVDKRDHFVHQCLVQNALWSPSMETIFAEQDVASFSLLIFWYFLSEEKAAPKIVWFNSKRFDFTAFPTIGPLACSLLVRSGVVSLSNVDWFFKLNLSQQRKAHLWVQ